MSEAGKDIARTTDDVVRMNKIWRARFELTYLAETHWRTGMFSRLVVGEAKQACYIDADTMDTI